MNIIITEKPSVAQEYIKILNLTDATKKEGYVEGTSTRDGKQYQITWAVGHLVTLSYPEKYDESLKKWTMSTLPFLPDEYMKEVISKVKKQFSVVKKLYNAKNVDTIYLAGDSGQEGLLIQSYILEMAGHNKNADIKVVWINSQTESEILRGLKEAKPFSEYKNLDMAGRMRSIEDYAIGINFSRALTLKFGRQFNAQIGSDKTIAIAVGRVMTCVLGMIVAKEKEIADFKETVFYRISASNNNFEAKWKVNEDSKLYNSPLLYDNEGFLDKNNAESFLNELSADNHLTVQSLNKKTEKKQAPLLFNLAELQSSCTKLFKISPDETLKAAQKLYEMKLTTYPRTDARVLSSAVADEIDKNLKGLNKTKAYTQYTSNILSEGIYKNLKKTKYVNDEKITDHYAIIPTGEGDSSQLDGILKDIYDLIVKRFLSIFYPAAEYVKTEAVFKHSNGETFTSSSKVQSSLGYMEILKGDDEEDEKEVKNKLDDLNKGDIVDVNFKANEGKTSPPKRYTSGSMILAMENAGNLIEEEDLREQIKSCGIGTSATRAEIIKKLINNSYIKLNKKTQVLTPTDAGFAIFDIVSDTIPRLLSPKMTASWQQGLSRIEKGEVAFEQYKLKMDQYIIDEVNKIKAMESAEVEDKVYGNCPFCDGEIKSAKFGYKCSNYGKNEDDCKFYINKIPEEQLLKLINGEITDDVTLKNKDGVPYVCQLKVNDGTIEKIFPKFDTEPIGKCPFCGKNVVPAKNGYKCEDFEPGEGGCSFYVSVNKEQAIKLLQTGSTDVVTLKNKEGKKYDCKLIVKDNKIERVFTNDYADKKFTCPKCGETLKYENWNYVCDCGVSIPTMVAKRKLNAAEINALIAGRTGVLSGFKSKDKKSFKTYLYLDDDYKVCFGKLKNKGE